MAVVAGVIEDIHQAADVTQQLFVKSSTAERFCGLVKSWIVHGGMGDAQRSD